MTIILFTVWRMPILYYMDPALQTLLKVAMGSQQKQKRQNRDFRNTTMSAA